MSRPTPWASHPFDLQMLAQQFLGELHPLGIGRPPTVTARGSVVNRLRPVGRTSLAPAIGDPEARGAGNARPRPRSAVDLARRHDRCTNTCKPVTVLRFLLIVADKAVDAGQRLCRAGTGIKT